MLTPQQQEALAYFSQAAGEWRGKAEGRAPKFNVIAARNAYVRMIAGAMKIKGGFLDVGCGTGELACDLAREGWTETGIDFAPDMIKLSKEKASEQGVKAEFVCASVFEHAFAPASFDLIAANGFIEYISAEELQKFLQLSRRLLKKNGMLVVGSRNRLFNAFSLNAFTEMELACGTLPHLVREAMEIASAKGLTTLFRSLASEKADLPRHIAHPGTTGIGVTVRHQYTPSELIKLFAEHHLDVAGLYPVHYHAFPPRFKDTYPSIHADIATMFQSFAALELLPFSSTFMITAKTH